MMSAIRRIKQFLKEQQAAAAVEFALVVPLMLVLYVASIEVSQAFVADRRVTTLTGTVGDLVARSNGELTTDTLDSYFAAAQPILQPFPLTGLKQVISQLKIDKDGNATVDWSVGFHGGEAHVPKAAFQIDDVPEMAKIAVNSYLIVSETSYDYSSPLGLYFKTTIPFYHRNYYLPRFGGSITCEDC